MSAMCGGQGDRQKAYKLLMEANEFYQDIGDAMLGQYVQIDSAWQVWFRGNLREGLAIMEDYLAYQRGTHFKWAVSDILSGLTWMNLFVGEYAQALHMAEESLKARSSTLIDIDESWGLFDLGRVEFSQGNFKAARQRLESAFKIFHNFQHKWGVCATLNYLGLAALFEGRLEEGLAKLEESRTFCEQFENPDDGAVVVNLLFLGQAVSQQGDFARAGALIRQSLERVMSGNDVTQIPSRLEGLAAVAMGQARYHDSAVLLGAAHQQRQVMGAPLWPVERPAYEKLISGLKAALSEVEFQQAWETGAALSVEQSITFALEKTS